MSEDNPYDDVPEDAHVDGDVSRPQRGTASRANPLTGERPPGTADTPTIRIKAPDNSVREYELTDRVKERYETMVDQKFESLDVDWYDYWWQGTKLVVEYQGKVRDSALRDMEPERDPGQGQPEDMGPPQQPSGMPRSPHPVWFGRRGVHQLGMSPGDSDNDDEEYFDGCLAPVCNRTTIDIQERADRRPLVVEDLFVRPWDDDSDTPINTEEGKEDGEVEFEIEDFRDVSDDETLAEGERGNRFYL